MHDWVLGTPDNDWVSMAVPSDGSYGIPEGLVFSFPVTCKDGDYHIVQGLEFDEFGQSKIDATRKELEEENRVIFRYCSDEGETNIISNPNGSINNIAGIINKQGNVLGMMPHPEKACEKLIG